MRATFRIDKKGKCFFCEKKANVQRFYTGIKWDEYYVCFECCNKILHMEYLSKTLPDFE